MLKINDERHNTPATNVETGQIRESPCGLGMVLVSRELNEGKLCITSFDGFYTEELEVNTIRVRYPKVLNAELIISE